MAPYFPKVFFFEKKISFNIETKKLMISIAKVTMLFSKVTISSKWDIYCMYARICNLFKLSNLTHRSAVGVGLIFIPPFEDPNNQRRRRSVKERSRRGAKARSRRRSVQEPGELGGGRPPPSAKSAQSRAKRRRKRRSGPRAGWRGKLFSLFTQQYFCICIIADIP